MKDIFKPFIPIFILKLWRRIKAERSIKEWKDKGYPAPPPHSIKQRAIAEYQKMYNYGLLIETGTFMGEMVDAQKKRFKKIISIELGPDLYKQAKEKFSKDKNVIIAHGDSGKLLPVILKDVNEPAIFWLDGHYSAGVTAKGDKECPIYEEVNAIFSSKPLNHVLLIDDARCFNGEGDYPAIHELTNYVKTKNQNYRVEVKHDIIRYIP